MEWILETYTPKKSEKRFMLWSEAQPSVVNHKYSKYTQYCALQKTDMHLQILQQHNVKGKVHDCNSFNLLSWAYLGAVSRVQTSRNE